MRFDWDEKKNKENQRKHHGLSFETAVLVFDDPNHLVIFDRVEEGETRWHAIGSLQNSLMCLTVVHTYAERDETVRIISARKATRKETDAYYDQKL